MCIARFFWQLVTEGCSLQVHQVPIPAPPATRPLILGHTRHLHEALCSADNRHGQCEAVDKSYQTLTTWHCIIIKLWLLGLVGAVQAGNPPPMSRLGLVEQVERKRRRHSCRHHRTGVAKKPWQSVFFLVTFFFWHISPQFNAVSYRVISTVLIDSEARPAQRARVISAWVDVAQVVFISVLGIVILPGSSKSLNDICIGCRSCWSDLFLLPCRMHLTP